MYISITEPIFQNFSYLAQDFFCRVIQFIFP